MKESFCANVSEMNGPLYLSVFENCKAGINPAAFSSPCTQGAEALRLLRHSPQ